jgi:hypothetical protein
MTGEHDLNMNDGKFCFSSFSFIQSLTIKDDNFTAKRLDQMDNILDIR